MSAKRLGAFTGEFEEHALGLGDVLESVRLVETRGPIIDGVYDEGPGPQFHADAERPNDGVMKQATAQTVALEPSVDPQHAQQNHGHPFWDVPLEPSARYARTLHGMGAERVESGELAGFGIGDIRDGGALPLGARSDSQSSMSATPQSNPSNTSPGSTLRGAVNFIANRGPYRSGPGRPAASACRVP